MVDGKPFHTNFPFVTCVSVPGAKSEDGVCGCYAWHFSKEKCEYGQSFSGNDITDMAWKKHIQLSSWAPSWPAVEENHPRVEGVPLTNWRNRSFRPGPGGNFELWSCLADADIGNEMGEAASGGFVGDLGEALEVMTVTNDDRCGMSRNALVSHASSCFPAGLCFLVRFRG